MDSHLLSTPFLWACRNGHIETVKYLISLQQTDLMARDYKGRNVSKKKTVTNFDSLRLEIF